MDDFGRLDAFKQLCKPNFMMDIHRSTLILAASLAIAGQVSAMDLPVKKIGSQDFYYYQVQKGETIYSLSKKFSVSRDEIVENNPAVADGLKSGTTLYFPVSKFSDRMSAISDEDKKVATSAVVYEVKKGESLYGISHRYGLTPEQLIAQNPGAEKGIKAGQKLYITTASKSDTIAAVVVPKSQEKIVEPQPEHDQRLRPVTGATIAPEQITESDDKSTKDGSVIVALPFMLDDANVSKQAQLYTDFYKGFLMAADTLSKQDGQPINIYTFDTTNENNTMSRLLESDEAKKASVIIVSGDDGIPSEVIKYSTDNATYVLNLFSIKDSTYTANPYIIQANIPHRLMYKKAANAILDDFRGYTPLFIENQNGKNEKIEFTSYLKNRCKAEDIDIVEINYENTLHSSAFDELDMSRNYVIIPASGSLSEFNKIYSAIKSLRENHIGYGDIQIFGYPDWLAFKGDAREMLHTLQATIYSRYFADATSLNNTSFTNSYREWYGVLPMAGIPNQALLGYDSGYYVIKNLKANKGIFNPSYPSTHYGLQSSYSLTKADKSSANISGYVNDALYIIKFLPEKIVTSKVL
jgi:LysM repeat protein